MFAKSRFAAAAAAAAVLGAASPSLAGVPTTTTTSLTASVNPVASSQSTTLKATVVRPALPVVCPGRITVRNVAQTICSDDTIAEGSNAVITCALTGHALSASGSLGVQSLVASFEASDGSCSDSQSTTLNITVTADPTAVPTVGEWTLWGMMGLMMMAGAALLVRRTRRQSVMGE